MNYLNPYIALGGRNPFRACYVMIYNSKKCIGILNTDLDSKSKLELKRVMGGTLVKLRFN